MGFLKTVRGLDSTLADARIEMQGTADAVKAAFAVVTIVAVTALLVAVAALLRTGKGTDV